MKKLFKKNAMEETIQAYIARAYCTCTCVTCGCSMCMPGDQAHDETVFQVTSNNNASNYQGMFENAN